MSVHRLPISLLFVALAFGHEIEPKRPLSPAQDLRVRQDASSIVVSGETFSYTFRKANGLISEIQVLGRTLTDGTPVPDLMAAEQLDPAYSPYRARHETQARVTLVSSAPDRAVIYSEGAYTAEDGRRFPLRYVITYDISIVGVVLVGVKNSASDTCTLRWLMLSAGAALLPRPLLPNCRCKERGLPGSPCPDACSNRRTAPSGWNSPSTATATSCSSHNRPSRSYSLLWVQGVA